MLGRNELFMVNELLAILPCIGGRVEHPAKLGFVVYSDLPAASQPRLGNAHFVQSDHGGVKELSGPGYAGHFIPFCFHSRFIWFN